MVKEAFFITQKTEKYPDISGRVQSREKETD